jgi:hypothetical protein
MAVEQLSGYGGKGKAAPLLDAGVDPWVVWQEEVGIYGLIAWAYHGVKSKMEADDRFRRRVEDIQRRISQQKI